MIPYLDFGSKQRRFEPDNPFVVQDKPLTVLIDRESFDDDADLMFLLRQADGEKLFVISTRREGNAYLEYGEIVEENLLLCEVKDLDGLKVSHHGIPMINQYKRLAASPEFTRWATPEEIERAFIMAQTVRNMNVHILITNDKFLLEHTDIGIIAESYPLNLADATALIGLVQRRRNNFDIIVDSRSAVTMKSSHGRWSFFWYTSRDLLPSAWRLVSGSAQMPSDKCRDLSLAAIYRTSNALKCRDHIHEQIFLEQTNSNTEDAIFYLDHYLVSFVAAFDVLARVADEIYKPITKKGERVRSISWRGDWRETLAKEDAALAELMRPETPNRDVLEFIARLRNYIHAEGLHGSTHIKDGKHAPLLLYIPEAEVADIADIIERLCGGNWVVDRPSPNVMFLELGDIIEKITPLAVKALDSIMAAIDVTKVPDFDDTKVQTKPPEEWVSAAELLDMRRLLGI